MELLSKRVAEREAKLHREHREHREQGRPHYLGVRKILRTNPTDSPKNPERRHTRRPAIAGYVAEDRVRAILDLTHFRAAYRTAWKEWSGGDRDAVSPTVHGG